MRILTISQSQRQGNFTSHSVTVPSGTDGACLLTPQIHAADFRNAALSFTYRIYRLEPSSGLWRMMVGSAWQGGGDPNDPDQLPAMDISASVLAGYEVRAELDVPERMRIGFAVDLVA
jgi:hypothetical protein